MIFARIETEEACEQLQQEIKEAKKPYIYRRLLIIQFSASGKTVNELAALFQLTPLTIRNYIHGYNHGGILGLMPAKKPGRRRKCQLTKEQWLDILHQSPETFEELGCASHNWTLELLAEYLKRYHGVQMHPSSVWHLLRRHKINMGRSQWKRTEPSPEYRVKRQKVETLKKKAEACELTSDDVTLIQPAILPIADKKQGVLIYYDETDIHWCPDKGKGYQQIGNQQSIETPGTDSVRYLLGGIVYPTGEGLFDICERKRTMEVESWLISICEMFEDRFIFLVWDNASTHTTEMLLPFFEAHQHLIVPVFLPTYSPWLNLIERLWLRMRADITRNHFFSSIDRTCQAVVHWLQQLPFNRFMSLIGISAEEPILIEASL
jgi:putative transposase